MPLVAPNLDDRTFEQLLREARLRIPRYCPDWTDFNDADPGMAVVQLFAWFTELMVYRMNRVPDRSYVKFLEMLNLQPRPARPARVVVCFTPARPGDRVRPGDYPTVPARSRLEAAGDGGPVTFETVEALDPVPYPLDAVQVFDGAEFADESGANERAGGSFRPFGWTPREGSAVYLGFLPPAGDPQGHQPAAFPARVVVQVYRPAGAVEPPEPTRRRPPPKPPQSVVWEYQSDRDLPPGQTRATRPTADPLPRWRRLETVDDQTAAFTREGRFVFRGPRPDALATLGGRPTPDGEPRFWVRCRLESGTYPQARVPEVGFVRANAAEAEHRATHRDEVLGESDGFAREYRLRNAPVDPASLELDVEPLGGGPERWERRDDLLASKADSGHYTLDAATGGVTFGNGRRGRLPPPRALVVARKYQAGGGRAGNVPANSVTGPPPGATGIEAVTNPRPATGGTDEETFEELREVVPSILRGDGRAVTRSDYERVAGRADGVAKAAVLPLAHPDYPGLTVPGAVTVVVVPDDPPEGRDGRPAGPQPTQDLLDRVYRDLDAVRPLGTELFVAPPRYRPVEVRARVEPADGVAESQARDAVRKAVEDYLAPVRRPDPKPAPALPAPAGQAPAGRPAPKPPEHPRGWPFGQEFIPSRLYPVILGAAGDDGRPLVRSAEFEFTIGGEPGDMSRPYRFDADELPVGQAEVDVTPPRTTDEDRWA